MIRLKKPPFISHFFYGWYVLVASFFILFFQSGARYSFGVMFKPMIIQLSWDRTSISSAFFLNMIFFALTLSIAGKLYDRYGPRWVIFISTILQTAGYIGTSFVDSLWEFYLYYGILTAAGTGGASVPLIGALMSKWFERNRGFTISLALSGNCLGQFVLVPFFNIIVLNYGWRGSYLLAGLIIFSVNIILALTVIKGNPADLGLKPLGYNNQDKFEGQEEQNTLKLSSKDLNLREVMHTYSFWLFLIVMFICGSGDFMITTHLIPLVTDHNISSVTAANMLAWFGLMSMGGILIVGPASDLIGNKIPLVLTFVIRLLLFLLILRYQNLFSFYIFAVVFGFTFFITAPLTTTFVGRLYGFSHVGIITGFITTVHHLGGGFWAFMAGLFFDTKGSYQIPFILSAIMVFLAVVASIFIKEKRH
jgi:MFS family permease